MNGFYKGIICFARVLIGVGLLWNTTVRAQQSEPDLIVGPNVNISRMQGNQSEVAIAIDPSNPQRMFVASKAYSSPGIFGAYTTNRAVSWQYTDSSDKTIADGNDPFPVACCDPTVTWDALGNLYLAYTLANLKGVAVLLSTNCGKAFSHLTTLGSNHHVDQATLTTGVAKGTNVLWATYRDYSLMGYPMVAQGVRVRGLGILDTFNDAQLLWGSAPGNFADIAVGPSGQVMVVYQSPCEGENQTTIRVQVDADGLGPTGFEWPVTATTTGVGGFDYIPAQPRRSIDAEAGIAWDVNPASPRYGRVYLVYTDESPDESNNTDVMLRYSDDDGLSWSAAVRVNDDSTTNAQLLPRIAIDSSSGNVAISWLDCRNDAGTGSKGDRDGLPNTDTQLFAAVSTSGGTCFSRNYQVSAGISSTSTAKNSMDHGDYLGLAFAKGFLFPVWTDNSNSTKDNPDRASSFDLYTAPVSIGNMISAVGVESHSTSAFVTWKTSVAATTQVAYGPGTNCVNISTLDPAPNTNHVVWLTGLLPQTLYNFRADSTFGPNSYHVTGKFVTTASNAADNPPQGSVPSWWGKFFFGTNVSGSADLDGDGLSNYTEYLFGTAPDNSASRLSFELQRIYSNGICALFRPFQGGRVYQLQCKTNVESRTWAVLSESPTITPTGEGKFVIANPNATGSFFRLGATIGTPNQRPSLISDGQKYAQLAGKYESIKSPADFDPVSTNDEIALALNVTNLNWNSGGSSNWIAQTSTTHDGISAAESPTLLDGEQSWLEITVTGPGTISFWWKVSSELDFDFLEFCTNDVVCCRISGEVDWEPRSVFINPGVHTLQWRYRKDAFVANRQDKAWLDEVSWEPSNVPFVTSAPLTSEVTEGDTVTLSITAVGPSPLSYQWTKDTAPIEAGTDSSLTISPARFSDTGTYSVVVSNEFGSAMSPDATVTVLSGNVSEYLDAVHLTWQSGGNALWGGQNKETKDGSDAACSGKISDLQESWVETTITGPASVSFYWKVSSENEYDYLRFTVNGIQQYAICGETDWERRVCKVGEGTQVLRWAYTKDGDSAAGQDKGWLDEVVCVPVYPTIVVDAGATGGYTSTGSCVSGLYAVGNVEGYPNELLPIRNWYTFMLPKLPAPVVWARLSIFSRVVSLGSGPAYYELHHLDSWAPDLVTGGSGLTNVFEDLADGPLYAQHLFYGGESFQTISIPLNDHCLSDLWNASGWHFGLGGQLVCSTDPEAHDFLFGYSQNNLGDVQLVLGFGPPPLAWTLPEPTGNCLLMTARDPGGEPINPLRLPYIAAFASSDLQNWLMLTNALVWTNGVLQLDDSLPTEGARYYKIIETPP